jgi:bifunctional non-homologous end joining protein LigD
LKLGRRAAPSNDPEWIYELKLDGFRALAYIDDGSCRLVSRKGNAFKSWPGLCSAIAGLRCDEAVLDGEIVSLDDDGKPHFYSLPFRRREPVFYAFDLLWLNGRDFRQHPLIERKSALRKLLKAAPPDLRYVEHFKGADGVAFFHACCSQDLEGVIAKRRDSTYLNADHQSAWLKIKNPAYSQNEGREELFERRMGVPKKAL